MTAGAAADTQGFAFTDENRARADAVIAKYPPGCQASAVLPLLDLAQRQNGGWISQAAMEHVGALLDMAAIRVYEVATFYTMLNLEPVGRHHVQLCRTTPCWLRGADALRDACREELGIGLGGTTEDGLFTLTEVECLGACVNAPMVQIGDHFYEDLDPARMKDILRAFRDGTPPPSGPQTGRQTSAPASGPTTLSEL